MYLWQVVFHRGVQRRTIVAPGGTFQLLYLDHSCYCFMSVPCSCALLFLLPRAHAFVSLSLSCIPLVLTHCSYCNVFTHLLIFKSILC
jgi:hypothetical protein